MPNHYDDKVEENISDEPVAVAQPETSAQDSSQMQSVENEFMVQGGIERGGRRIGVASDGITNIVVEVAVSNPDDYKVTFYSAGFDSNDITDIMNENGFVNPGVPEYDGIYEDTFGDGSPPRKVTRKLKDKKTQPRFLKMEGEVVDETNDQPKDEGENGVPEEEDEMKEGGELV